MREQEAGKIVHREPQFATVCTLAPLGTLRSRSDSGVADEDIEPLVIGEDGCRKLPCAGQRRQIRLVENDLAVPLPPDLLGKGFGAIAVAAVDQHLGVRRGEFRGDITADPIGRSGDQDGLAVHLHVTAPARRCLRP